MTLFTAQCMLFSFYANLKIQEFFMAITDINLEKIILNVVPFKMNNLEQVFFLYKIKLNLKLFINIMVYKIVSLHHLKCIIKQKTRPTPTQNTPSFCNNVHMIYLLFSVNSLQEAYTAVDGFSSNVMGKK